MSFISVSILFSFNGKIVYQIFICCTRRIERLFGAASRRIISGGPSFVSAAAPGPVHLHRQRVHPDRLRREEHHTYAVRLVAVLVRPERIPRHVVLRIRRRGNRACANGANRRCGKGASPLLRGRDEARPSRSGKRANPGCGKGAPPLLRGRDEARPSRRGKTGKRQRERKKQWHHRKARSHFATPLAESGAAWACGAASRSTNSTLSTSTPFPRNSSLTLSASPFST